MFEQQGTYYASLSQNSTKNSASTIRNNTNQSALKLLKCTPYSAYLISMPGHYMMPRFKTAPREHLKQTIKSWQGAQVVQTRLFGGI